MKILATYNIKGGVGKTATAVNLAYLAAREGLRTLLWDLDPQGAASFYFRIKPKVKGGVRGLLRRSRSLDNAIKATDFEGLDLMPADFSYRHMDLGLNDARKPVKQLRKIIKPLSKEYDLLFLDCAPSISLVSENVFYTADALLIPMIPTTLSLRTYKQLLRFFKQSPIGHVILLPFFSMVDLRKRLHRETIKLVNDKQASVLKTMIPYASQIELMGVRRAPLGSYGRLSTATLAFEKLWKEIKSQI